MEEIGEVNGDSNAHYGMGRVILEDSLEEEVSHIWKVIFGQKSESGRNFFFS